MDELIRGDRIFLLTDIRDRAGRLRGLQGEAGYVVRHYIDETYSIHLDRKHYPIHGVRRDQLKRLDK